MKTVAIIPARGHSKGILRKNLQLINGKPLVAHSIEAALSTNSLDRVVVSTDDPEIRSISIQYGADVIVRPDNISGDTASSESAILHVLDELEKRENYVPEVTVFLQCTSPLTKPADIDNCIKLLIHQNADTALTVTDFHYFIWGLDERGDAIGINHEKSIRNMRQERKNQFLETGAVYVMRTEGFKIHRHRFFGRTVMHYVPIERCLEIDEAVDLKTAEILMSERQTSDNMHLLPDKIGALICNFDGVFTDNRVIIQQSGQEAVLCERSDGMGLSRLKRFGIPVLVISTEKNPIVKAHCRRLNISYIQGFDNKLEALFSWLKEKKLKKNNTIFLGNDINDKKCLQEVGCSVVVNDAHPTVKRYARIVLSKPGGKGAIRELTDLIEKKIRG